FDHQVGQRHQHEQRAGHAQHASPQAPGEPGRLVEDEAQPEGEEQRHQPADDETLAFFHLPTPPSRSDADPFPEDEPGVGPAEACEEPGVASGSAGACGCRGWLPVAAAFSAFAPSPTVNRWSSAAARRILWKCIQTITAAKPIRLTMRKKWDQ